MKNLKVSDIQNLLKLVEPVGRNMADEINLAAVTILERCEVAPPPGSLPSTLLPLTFFDLPWFYCLPVQRIFFFDFPHPTHHFLQSVLPPLKQSLSITLQHFFPFASNLIVPPQPHTVAAPYIRYLPGDSLPFTVAESNSNFNLLVSNSPQDVRNWHPLAPTLPSPRTEEDGTRVIPLMAIQLTILPNSGFSICFTFNHLATDGRSLHHFIKFWASVCKLETGDSASSSPEAEATATPSLPFHDRDRVKDPKGLKLIYLKELQHPGSQPMEFAGLVRDVFTNKVRATLVLSRERVEKLKNWMITLSDVQRVSTFVVTCSLVWVCLMKSEQSKGDGCVAKSNDQLCYLVFLADCRDHPEFSLPSTYFGNCLATCIVALKRSEVVGENGIVEVAKAVQREVRNWKSGPLRNAETLMSDYREVAKPDQSVLIVAGSPKLGVYKTDFGWGKPKKSESVHIDRAGSITLSDCRDNEGGIGVGLALETVRMNNFINMLEQQFVDINVACE